MKYWIISHLPSNSLVRNQYQMAWSRILFVAACLLYTLISTSNFEQYGTVLLGFSAIYLILHAFAAIRVEVNPIAPWRILALIALDVALVSLTMIADTGTSSGVYFFFFIIAFMSAYWFGTPILICAQVLILIAYLTVAAISGIHDTPTFVLHLLEIIIIPAFAILLGHQSEDALSEKATTERNTFGMLDQGPLPVFTFSLDGEATPRIRYVNHAVQQIFSGDPMNLIGESVEMLSIPEDADEMCRSCRRIFGTQHKHKSLSFFIRGQNEDGEMLQLMGLTAQVVWQGEWIGVCFLFDITQSESRRNEMNESMQEGYMSTLVAGIVHDFRNVLTSIIGTAEVLQFTVTDKLTQDQLGVIIDAGERGSETITHLLHLSSSGEDEKDTTYTDDVEHTLNSIMELLRIQLPEHIQLHCEIDDILPQIKFEIAQLEQVLMNLVNNAAQAIEGQGQIVVRVGPDYGHKMATSKNPALKIRIKDNGCGISEEDLPYVTQNFWTSRKDSGGTGLGLAMVKRIINNHGGELEITSKVGAGTQVHVYLPGVQSDKPDKPATQQVGEKEKPVAKTASTASTIKPNTRHIKSVKSSHILLVDDNSDVLQVHCMQLEAMGHQVTTAMSGDEALEIYQAQRDSIQMLVTDFKMPGMDGIDLATELRAQSPDLPMLMVTAYGETEKLNRATDLKITMLLKPSTFQKFSEAIIKIQKDNPASFS